MTKVKKNYSASFKTQVALSLIREDETISELSSRYGVNPSVMRRWKKQALDNKKRFYVSNHRYGLVFKESFKLACFQ